MIAIIAFIIIQYRKYHSKKKEIDTSNQMTDLQHEFEKYKKNEQLKMEEMEKKYAVE